MFVCAHRRDSLGVCVCVLAIVSINDQQSVVHGRYFDTKS